MMHSGLEHLPAGADAWQQADAIVEAIQEPQFPEHRVNVRELGARGDGAHNDLPALQTAVNQCSEAGGGTVLVPPGTYWLEGPLHLKSHINLQLEEGSILRFSAELDDFLPVVYTRWEVRGFLITVRLFTRMGLKMSPLPVPEPSTAIPWVSLKDGSKSSDQIRIAYAAWANARCRWRSVYSVRGITCARR